VLQRSNWNAQARMLNDVDPEGLDHEAHSFGHWACGHFDIVLVRPGSDCAKEAERIQDALAEYPVLDEADWSNAEHQEICEFWQHESLKSRVLLCSEAGVSIFAARREAPPDKVYESLRDEVL
jgi:hypothetical protein